MDRGARFFIFCLVGLSFSLLSGCISGVWTGANLVYTRHHVYKKVNDYNLSSDAQKLLFHDKRLREKGCNLDLAVFNGDVLLAGHTPDAELRALAFERLQNLKGARAIYKHVAIDPNPNNGITDTWLTTKIISQMVADSSIDPSSFKVVSVDNIVYLMGDVRPEQGRRVIHIARTSSDVIRVVKLLNYYALQEKA